MGDNLGFINLRLPDVEILLLSTDCYKICWLIYNLRCVRGMFMVVKFIDAMKTMNYYELSQFHTQEINSLSCSGHFHAVSWFCDRSALILIVPKKLYLILFFYFWGLIASTNQCFYIAIHTLKTASLTAVVAGHFALVASSLIPTELWPIVLQKCIETFCCNKEFELSKTRQPLYGLKKHNSCQTAIKSCKRSTTQFWFYSFIDKRATYQT